MENLRPILPAELFLLFFSSVDAREAEASAIIKLFPGIVLSLGEGSGVGLAVTVGLIDVDGEVVSDGELLGRRDGDGDDCIEGDADVEGDWEGMVDG
mmetsp:Transcript_25589/g.54034  ORF Transcript_25589/g.54034 Transcript_25589/m.54034 type:complete len:97 (+) Transcript_25589:360-650(+)|eukprot:CAMPEP_0184412042 /NCGR_PEP_ID=MMETSP0738-20130409/6146_1 /TAXON_ID=385413 /ORGANISM="Thalassiosira miniscula, Strain CCMP1093" /LENGTH=96 /DNA_ID=CAMNT_0026770417 /DNA_START=371 /DNA_END=661 /DNA_ORIENTATION=+